MSDFIDDAAESEHLQREIAIKEVRERKSMPFMGHCLICNIRIEHGQFCGPECQADYEVEQRIREISGNFLSRSRR